MNLPTDLSKEIPVAIWSMLSERIRSMLDLSLSNVYMRGYQDATRQAREDMNELLYPKPLPVLGAEVAAVENLGNYVLESLGVEKGMK